MLREQFDPAYEQIAEFFKTFSNPHRLKIIGLLLKNEFLDVNEISKTLVISQSSVSQHLKILKFHQMVKEKRDGKHVYYSLTDSSLSNVIEDVFKIYSHQQHGGSDKVEQVIQLSSVWKDQVKYDTEL